MCARAVLWELPGCPIAPSVAISELHRQSSLNSVPYHTRPAQRGVDLDCQALSRVVIDDVQHAEPSPRTERVGHEVHRSHFIGSSGFSQRLAHRAPLPPPLAPQRQLFFHVRPVHSLVVHLPSLTFLQHLQAPITELASNFSQLPQPHP